MSICDVSWLSARPFRAWKAVPRRAQPWLSALDFRPGFHRLQTSRAWRGRYEVGHFQDAIFLE